MIISHNGNKIDDIIDIVSNYTTDDNDCVVPLDERECALVKFADQTAGEYQSFSEYALSLEQTIYEEIGEKVDIAIGGTVKNAGDLQVSFSQAISVQKMSKSISLGGGVHSFKEYVFIKMLEDLPKHKLSEYLQLLLDERAKEIFEDKEMIETAEEFLDNSLNVSETARKLYLHRNTLTYRLDKIERATGLNIRKFQEAVTFRLITILSKIIG